MSSLRTTYPVLNAGAAYKPLNDIPERLKRFTGETSRHSTLTGLISQYRLDDHHVKLYVWSAPGQTKPSFEEAVKQDFRPAKKGESFGPAWTNHWFRVELDIPTEWRHLDRVQFEFDCSGEAMVMTSSGVVQHGLTGGYDRDRRVEFILPREVVEAGKAVYYLEASCNAMFGQAVLTDPNPGNVGQDLLDSVAGEARSYRLNCADLVAVHLNAQKLAWDFTTLQQLASTLPTGTVLQGKAQYTANRIINTFDADDQNSLQLCRDIAEEVLGKNWEENLQDEASGEKGRVWAIGHCHIDTAWLWPIEVTQQKSARSWSTQCDLMDRYPEHRFSATQAQQYKWVEKLYPQLFERIKNKVDRGMFQPVGGSWVEMDVNMPSGEALCRQFLYGQRYFESRFGVRSHTCVLPDTFGYCAQLPQIIRLADMQDFFTIKLSWNAINKFPHSTFNWVGLDGTQVLAHLSPTDSYSSQCNVDEFRQAVTAHKNLDVTASSIFLFGNGDGGGGPTPVMLEKVRRYRAINEHLDAAGLVPKVHLGGDFGGFFDSVREETDNGATLPIWRGEMYFECHRGTYTTHAAIKRGNRKNEILIRQAEYAATLASLTDTSFSYPFERLDASWEDLLLCQFHDVLPGSGIAMIYTDAKRKYARMEKDLTLLLQESLAVLHEDPSATATWNTLPGIARREVVAVSGSSILPKSAQKSSVDGATSFVVLSTTEHSSIAEVVQLDSTIPSVWATQVSTNHFVLENSSIKLTILDGRITSILDTLSKRELIPSGTSGGLVIMEDIPNNYDAWDIDSFHLDKQRHLAFQDVTIAETGPLRASITATVALKSSVVKVAISLDAVGPSVKANSRGMVRFDAHVDWSESHKILKFELPVTISSSDAIFDAQFGYVKRPTHRNTSQDAAKFEVCGHTFADLSEYGYGVAILNDSKYGYAVNGNVMTLSLLRAPKSPDPDADMGAHEFSWAVYPHAGTFVESDVSQVAAIFNSPMIPRISHPHAQFKLPYIPFSISGSTNVVLDTIKRGEGDRKGVKGDKAVVIRLFERLGGHSRTTLNVRGFKVTKAEIVNVLEDHLADLEFSRKDDAFSIDLNFRGFEIQTVRLTLA